MNVQLEELIIYGSVALLILIIVLIYIGKMRKQTRIVKKKIELSKLEGLYEPVSLHPVVDPNTCIQTGACVAACPEKDILGILNGKATTINASRCIGHGACFHACPMEAITLCIGTEKRGVDLPHVNPQFETNVRGIYIAGELGGMGLIKNAVEQGRQAIENLVRTFDKSIPADYDLVIVGAGPAGISASLAAKKHGLKALTVEQESLGGAVFHFPRSKVVMTSAMDLPLYGKIKLTETKKSALLDLWNKVLTENDIKILERTKVEEVTTVSGRFLVKLDNGKTFYSRKVLLAIGRRGSPRKLNVQGEELEKVAYRLLEPEMIKGKNVMVVGGGDSAVESAIQLGRDNTVTLSYRGDSFSRIKPKNNTLIKMAMSKSLIDVKFNTNVNSISEDKVELIHTTGKIEEIPNDLVYVFAGGELPTQFLERAGIQITRKFGEALLKH